MVGLATRRCSASFQDLIDGEAVSSHTVRSMRPYNNACGQFLAGNVHHLLFGKRENENTDSVAQTHTACMNTLTKTTAPHMSTHVVDPSFVDGGPAINRAPGRGHLEVTGQECASSEEDHRTWRE